MLGPRSVRSQLAVLAALIALFVSATALGASPDGSTRRLESIRTQMEAGQAKYLAGDYAGAAELFEAGFRTHPYSAFLFNAGVCYQKLGELAQALEKFREYLKIDPNAPDRDKVAQRIAALEAQAAALVAPPADPGAVPPADAPGTPPAVAPAPDEPVVMKSLVVIETEPAGAPLRLYERADPNAAPFRVGTDNPGWVEVLSAVSPTDVTLDVGRYHVVVEKYRDFNLSETDIDVSPGHVHHFKANLSQGAFMAFLRVSSNVKAASIYLDDRAKHRPAWGHAPHGELVVPGPHEILVEAPGYEPRVTQVALRHGEQKELTVELSRVGYGYLRVRSRAPRIAVAIDGAPRGTWRQGEPSLAVRLPAGPHRLVVTADGRKTFDGLVEVPRGQVQPVYVQMIPKYPRGAAWAEAIIGGAVLGAGIYLGTESDRLYDELAADRRSGVLAPDDERATRGKWFAVGADAGFVLGGVLAGLATYNFLKDPLPESSIRLEPRTEFDPTLTGVASSRAPALLPRRLSGAPRTLAGSARAAEVQ